MNYIGSKRRLSGFIYENIKHIVGPLEGASFCDLFAGTGCMGRVFLPIVKHVIANDIEPYSFVLNQAYLNGCDDASYQILLDTANALPGKKGLLYTHYSSSGPEKRNYFTSENAQKIDHVRIWIQETYDAKKIDKATFYCLLGSLLEAADKVANTASVYAAFLKHTKSSASKPLVLRPIPFDKIGTASVYQQNAQSIISHIQGDILYLDPPYNNRQYGNYYHLLNTIVEYQEIPFRGKTGMRDYFKSDFCRPQKVVSALRYIVEHAAFKFIFLSYNNEGILSNTDIQTIFSDYGQYRPITKVYPRFKSDTPKNRVYKANKTTEYLHVLIKDNLLK